MQINAGDNQAFGTKSLEVKMYTIE